MFLPDSINPFLSEPNNKSDTASTDGAKGKYGTDVTKVIDTYEDYEYEDATTKRRRPKFRKRRSRKKHVIVISTSIELDGDVLEDDHADLTSEETWDPAVPRKVLHKTHRKIPAVAESADDDLKDGPTTDATSKQEAVVN